ncbi:hypothetical protein CathTA2_0750 [Caldalkalibacillus thermarum TA2.A1]|uniref:Uncharacterized protein n=1 Tax=Caldalkalibacillus thermarum (strain TA2.A1) TaxID=986075 RepID=F5L4N7_CALTT|nr:hypothetical protein [Caldalkalibacillus thermarum]EGL83703.1 hypothetical protein CathTA2_0750 [Caldalkalibacillus thermarum TA2.A1]QZT33949.1 hypothetical protein HUR95_00465 [Caldalkalibacillus thermarum TA2.A1]
MAGVRYNKRALREIKRAYNLFQRHERKYKKGEGIGELTALLGGWDTNALFAPTQAYFEGVYREIFSKLQPEVKVEFTEQILNVNKKVVG